MGVNLYVTTHYHVHNEITALASLHIKELELTSNPIGKCVFLSLNNLVDV